MWKATLSLPMNWTYARRPHPRRCATSASSRLSPGVACGPFLGGADVLDGGVEPDVEHLVLETRAGLAAAHDGDAPGEIAGDAPVDEALVEVLVGDGAVKAGQKCGLGGDPGADGVGELRLLQVEVAGFADLEIAGAGDHRIGADEVRRVEQVAAVVALVAPGLLEAAVGAGALDVAVRAGTGRRRWNTPSSSIRSSMSRCLRGTGRGAGSARGSGAATCGRTSPRRGPRRWPMSRWSSCCSSQ